MAIFNHLQNNLSQILSEDFPFVKSTYIDRYRIYWYLYYDEKYIISSRYSFSCLHAHPPLLDRRTERPSSACFSQERRRFWCQTGFLTVLYTHQMSPRIQHYMLVQLSEESKKKLTKIIKQGESHVWSPTQTPTSLALESTSCYVICSSRPKLMLPALHFRYIGTLCVFLFLMSLDARPRAATKRWFPMSWASEQAVELCGPLPDIGVNLWSRRPFISSKSAEDPDWSSSPQSSCPVSMKQLGTPITTSNSARRTLPLVQLAVIFRCVIDYHSLGTGQGISLNKWFQAHAEEKISA